MEMYGDLNSDLNALLLTSTDEITSEDLTMNA